MPVMDGLTLTKEIRKIHDKNELSIIALSGNSDDEVTALFLKSGANDYITKPFSKEEFSCRINNSIEALENIQYITNSLKRDTLTGLYNRRYFYTEVAKEYFHAMNEQESFVLAIADLDNLKELNEKYSNDMGDSGIIAVGDALRSSLAPSDTVARFSGGEFAIAMKNITREEANQKLERIRLAVESLHLRDKNDSPLPLHISIGATFSLEGSFEEMLSQADMLLYNAKQAGKNRVFFE
jgi:diguanylate cyclase (GGDEF)-like protein